MIDGIGRVLAVGGDVPRTEEALGQRHDVLPTEVATDHQRRSARVERPVVDAPELGAVRRSTVSRVPPDGR